MNPDKLKEAVEKASKYKECRCVGECLSHCLFARAILALHAENERLKEKLELSEANFKAARDILSSYGFEALKQEHDQLKEQIQKLTADNAAKDILLKRTSDITWEFKDHVGLAQNALKELHEEVKNNLSTPHPGQAMLERMERLEAVAEAARNFDFDIAKAFGNGTTPYVSKDDVMALNTALKALDLDAALEELKPAIHDLDRKGEA